MLKFLLNTVLFLPIRNLNLLQMILLISMIFDGLSRKIVYQKFNNGFSVSDIDWRLVAYDSFLLEPRTCGTQNFVYIDNQLHPDNSVFIKTFTLDAHYQIHFTFKFWRIDTWNSKKFIVYANYINQYENTFTNMDAFLDICLADQVNGQEVSISKTILHNFPTLTIVLKADGNKWGISNFELSIDECPSECESCSSTECFEQSLVPISVNWKTSEGSALPLSCGDLHMKGTFGNYMEIEINLGTHNKISSQMNFAILNANNPTITVKIDDTLVPIVQQLTPRIDGAPFYCFNIQNLQIIINEMDHTNPTIKIRVDVVMTQYQAGMFGPFFAVYDFLLFRKPKIQQIIPIESNELPYEGCMLDKSEFLEGCKFCVRSVCLQCDEGWVYMDLVQICLPQCGDLKIVQVEECDDGNSIPYDGCHECKYSCPKFCLQCLRGKCIECEHAYQLHNGFCHYKCDDKEQQSKGCFSQIENQQLNGYYQHTILNQDHLKFFLVQFLDCNPQNYGIFGFYYDQCQINYIPQCKDQSWNSCLECMKGYELTQTKYQCISICNDGSLVDYEQCDDGNKIQFDGCYQCQSSCQLECLTCVDGKCLLCQDGWYLIDDKCQSICGDGILTSFEQCDDGNKNIEDGCFECYAECSNCQICNYKNNCQLCQDHFHSVQGICLPICGDNYIEIGLEECDDGNDLQFDGCFNCQLECYPGCQKCYYGKCKDLCLIDEQIVDGVCIKINNNDQNNMNDSECKDGCQECLQNQCIRCLINFELLDGKCYKIECGNGLQETSEQCDDGNTLSTDGCSNLCVIESDWSCQRNNNQISQCFLKTIAYLEHLNSTNLFQYVQLTYSKKIRLDNNTMPENFLPQNSYQILGYQKDQYLITYNPIVPIVQYEHRYINYEFKIQFYYQIQNKLNLTIQINNTLLDENEISVSNTNVSIELKVLKILTPLQKFSAKTLKTIGYSLMISLGCSSFVMLLLGEFAKTIQLLDILQYQQFLKYINVDYPYNVEMYFESSNFITLEPLLAQLQFISLYENIIQKSFQQSIGKFKEYQLNADFLTNIDSFLFQLICGVAFILILYIYENFVSKHISTENIISKIVKCKYHFIQQMLVYLYNYKRKNLELSNIINRNTFIQFFYANSWDLTFKVGLFLISNTESEYRQKISILICFIYLGIMMKFSYMILENFISKLKVLCIKKFTMKNQFYLRSSLFIWYQHKCNTILQFKVYCYHFFCRYLLVQLQDSNLLILNLKL